MKMKRLLLASTALTLAAFPALGQTTTSPTTLPNFTTPAGRTITFQNLSAVLPYNWNYPPTAGLANQVLRSQGGGSTSMDWTSGTLDIGSGVALTVNRTMTLTGVVDGAILSLGGNFTTGSGVAFTVNRTMTLTGGADGYILNMGGNITTAAAFTQAGAFATTLRATGVTDVTLPTTGTLATLAGSEALTNKTYNGLTLDATTGRLILTNGKTVTQQATLTYTGSDGSSINFGSGGTVTYTTSKLSAFASTTSAELAGVISNETGSGFLVFATSPALITPDIGAATGTSLLGSAGSLTVGSGGTGALSLSTSGGTQFKITHTASANNFISATGSNGGNVFLAADGGGTNIGFVFRQKGNEFIYFQDSSGNNLFTVGYTASAANRFLVSPGATGVGPSLSVSGETNVDLKLTPAGTGVVQFNTASSFTANNTVATVLGSVGPTGSHTTVQEWFTVKNSAGTVRYIPAF